MHFMYWEYVHFCKSFRCMYMHLCVCAWACSHVYTRQYHPYKWAKILCPGFPLAAASSPPGKEPPLLSEVPSTRVPNILYPNGPELAFSAYVGLSFRLSCATSAFVCPTQGLARGYKLKEGAWTWGQKEGGTKWARQYAFPTLLCSCSENS